MRKYTIGETSANVEKNTVEGKYTNVGKNILPVFLSVLMIFSSCRKEETVIPSTGEKVTEGVSGSEIKGFFLLNEGNMGNNKATLDYFDYETGVYTRNIYPERNPDVVKELGDVGNDLKIYGNKLYAVINCSNIVEVMDVETAKHITQISIPNCRYIAFDKGYAYVSSYAGPVQVDPNARLGYVAKIDTVTMKVVAECTVGYQPEELAVVGGKLYVANSGGYRVPDYDNTVSVVDLESFEVVNTIEVADNLHRIRLADDGSLWVSSRGNGKDLPSATYIIDPETDKVTGNLELGNSNMALAGSSLYLYSAGWNNNTGSNEVSYAIVDTDSREILSRSFITDGTEKNIRLPYGIAVNTETDEIFLTDARDYVTPGTLYCFSVDGKKKWSVTTGDIPSNIAFTVKRLK